MARALENRRRAALRAGTEALDRRPLVGVDLLDPQVVGEQLMVVLSVCNGGVEQLRPVTRSGTRRELQDRPCLRDAPPPNVIAHQSRLARRGPNVLRVRPDNRPPSRGSSG